MAVKKKPSVYSLALQQVQANHDEQRQSDSSTAEQLDNQQVEQLDSQTAKQSDSRTAKQQRIKATYYLLPSDIIAIDEMQTKRFKETGKKPEKSELVSEAIQLLFSSK